MPAPYIIRRQPPSAGFWANFSFVLERLDDANRRGLVPVVDMETSKNIYNEKEPLNGTLNSWEYYFEQPGGMSLQEARQKSPVFGPPTAEFKMAIDPATTPEQHLTDRRALIRKYIRVKPDILASADAIIPPGVHQDILGVHVRGTDMRRGGFASHPVPDVAMAFLEKARSLDRKHGFSSIFLATDEVETVEQFRNRFGSRLIVTDAYRVSETAPTPKDYTWLSNAERPRHRYLLGREVLIDVLLLARCGYFLASNTNVSQGVLLLSDESQQTYLLPPLWILPDTYGPSVGLRLLGEPQIPDAIDPVAVLYAQKKDLIRLLTTQENRLALTQQELLLVKQHLKKGGFGYLVFRLKKFFGKLGPRLRKRFFRR